MTVCSRLQTVQTYSHSLIHMGIEIGRIRTGRESDVKFQHDTNCTTVSHPYTQAVKDTRLEGEVWGDAGEMLVYNLLIPPLVHIYIYKSGCVPTS